MQPISVSSRVCFIDTGAYFNALRCLFC